MYDKGYRRRYYLNNKEKEYARTKKWRKNNKERLLEISRIYHKKKRLELRLKVLEHYGNKCSCCGESNSRFLTIDHINGGGRKHRLKSKSMNMYLIAKKEGFPKFLQILCYNCNYGKSLNNNICPHLLKKK